VTRKTVGVDAPAAGEISDKPTVVLESVFPSGEHACREYLVETESIPPGHEPEHWPVLVANDTGRLLLDTDALRAVWTGPGSWERGRV
jgi:hypothetical protein